MAEARHAIKVSKTCDVKGCSSEAERSISGDAATEAKLKVEDGMKRVHLCKEHYREYKKVSRKDRELGSLGRSFGK
ncbi:MAG TPA: hypothetical protein PLC39_01545 [Methanomassiliicoccales archaeon]|nr:hypothetical protein [Methanomassiliicoccales archaeon]HNX47211.1 hypothetical protein [Methanomassiliicoccales archaeon]HPR97969.1 hypothetical protein [Methanomassiliicoccales archaeon]